MDDFNRTDTFVIIKNSLLLKEEPRSLIRKRATQTLSIEEVRFVERKRIKIEFRKYDDYYHWHCKTCMQKLSFEPKVSQTKPKTLLMTIINSVPIKTSRPTLKIVLACLRSFSE